MSNISVSPQTIVKLLRCGLQRGSGHQLTFTDATSQSTYFNSRVLYTYTDFTYIRDNNSIAVHDNIESIRDCNYLMYQNKGFTNKWFYAFITDLEYVNENTTKIYFSIDSWQTWQWDFDYHPVFVEREHTNDDTIGANTIPENLETGDFTNLYYNQGSSMVPFLPYYCYVVATSTASQVYGGNTTTHGKIPNGFYYYAFDDDFVLKNFINQINNEHPDCVQMVFVAVKDFFSNWTAVTIDGADGNMSKTIDYSFDSTISFNKPTYIDKNYQPHNNKLFTYPYSYLQVTNSAGQVINYKWEEFNKLTDISGIPHDGKIYFRTLGTFTVGGSFKTYPVNYKGHGYDSDDSIVWGKLPVGSFTTDAYTNWLTQNGLDVAIDVTKNLALLGFSVGTGSLAMGAMGVAGLLNTANEYNGTSVSGEKVSYNGFGDNNASIYSLQASSNIAHNVSSIYKHSLDPDNIEGNINCGDVNYQFGYGTPRFSFMSIKKEYAEIIDNYWDMYGYKTNRVKIPNITGRANWNYVKTIGCTFDAKNTSKMSRQDEVNIQSMFDNGVTLWHNPNTMYDYSQSNSIVI